MFFSAQKLTQESTVSNGFRSAASDQYLGSGSHDTTLLGFNWNQPKSAKTLYSDLMLPPTSWSKSEMFPSMRGFPKICPAPKPLVFPCFSNIKRLFWLTGIVILVFPIKKKTRHCIPPQKKTLSMSRDDSNDFHSNLAIIDLPLLAIGIIGWFIGWFIGFSFKSLTNFPMFIDSLLDLPLLAMKSTIKSAMKSTMKSTRKSHHVNLMGFPCPRLVTEAQLRYRAVLGREIRQRRPATYADPMLIYIWYLYVSCFFYWNDEIW